MKKVWLMLSVASLLLPGVSVRAADLPSLSGGSSDKRLQLTGSLDVSLGSGNGKTAEGLSGGFLADSPAFSNHFVSTQVSPAGETTADDSGFALGQMNLQGGLGVGWGDDRIMFPLYHQEMRLDRERSYKYDALGVEWSRRFDSRSQLSLSAQHGDYVYTDMINGDTTNTMATVAWSSEFSGTMSPRLSSSLFLGDEAAKEQTTNGNFGKEPIKNKRNAWGNKRSQCPSSTNRANGNSFIVFIFDHGRVCYLAHCNSGRRCNACNCGENGADHNRSHGKSASDVSYQFINSIVGRFSNP